MEGPTPVSALIHAATMVTAGVYMVGRNAVLFSHAPMVMEIVAIVGVLTALMAASIGLVQYDIKRVLAYSTVSQLGYMFTAMGVGAFAAGAFHLMTHAFFKALLFLGSGSVIHAMGGEQDMRRMGGLKKYLPVTFATMMIGTLAIAGIPPLAGFFSKDEILFRAFISQQGCLGLAVVTALMTAFYMFRLMTMTFFGAYRGPAWETAGAGAARVAAGHGARSTAAARRMATRTARAHECARSRRTAQHDAHAAHAGHGHGAWHGPHESPTPDDVPADGARGRRDRRRLLRHPGGARRRQCHRALPRAELHRLQPRRRSRRRRAGGRTRSRRRRRGEHAAEGGARRRACLGGRRARADGVLGARSRWSASASPGTST